MKRRFQNWVIAMKILAREKRSVLSVIGYVDVKRHGSSRIARNLIPRSAHVREEKS